MDMGDADEGHRAYWSGHYGHLRTPWVVTEFLNHHCMKKVWGYDNSKSIYSIRGFLTWKTIPILKGTSSSKVPDVCVDTAHGIT